jgi:undecaprenyl-phosphate galactose phosphotransferase
MELTARPTAEYRPRRGLANGLSLLAADAAALLLAGVLAALFSQFLENWFFASPYLLLKHGSILETLWPWLLVSSLAMLWLHGKGHYRSPVPAWSEARDMAAAFSFCALAEAVLFYAIKIHVSRLWILQSWAYALPLSLIARGMAKDALLRLGLRQRRVILFGSGSATEEAKCALLSERSLGYVIAAVIEDAPTPAEAVKLARLAKADMAIVVLGECQHPGLLRALSANGIPCAAAPAVGGVATVGMDSQIFIGRDVLLLVERNNLENPLARFAKRAFDIVASLTALAVAWPFLAGLALAVRRDGGPAFFSHERVGRNGRRFACHKFRTMATDADAALARLLSTDAVARQEWDRDQKLRTDPRVTKLGRWLRASSVDELPQLWNVVRGEMSLVGPRPIVVAEIAKYGDQIGMYLQVRPGLTGLWQASGRNDVSYDRRVTLDGWYVRNWSLWTDIAIIAMTIPAVLKKRGSS